MYDNIYCVFDRLSGRYGSVFSSATNSTAILQFKNLFKNSPVHSKDYDLCHIGKIDLSTGKSEFTDLERIPVLMEIESDQEPAINAIEKNLN